MTAYMGGWMAIRATVTGFPSPSTGSQHYTAGSRQNIAIITLYAVCACVLTCVSNTHPSCDKCLSL